MADDRKPYTVNVAGVEHTMLLTDEDAKQYGDRATAQTKAAEPKNKARTVPNKTK